MKRELPILLTFDDGPDGSEGNSNCTLRVLETLASNTTLNGIVAAFFLQTHFIDNNYESAAPGTARGFDLAAIASQRGHLIEVHTGSKQHVPHPQRAASPPYHLSAGGKPVGRNALESDLCLAKQRIERCVGRVPEFVRATYLARDGVVDHTYEQVCLKHIGVNVDSKDYQPPVPTPERVQQTLRTGPHSVENAIAHGEERIIVLFHDVNRVTAEHLGDYIETIAQATRAAGCEPRFAASHESALEILRSW